MNKTFVSPLFILLTVKPRFKIKSIKQITNVPLARSTLNGRHKTNYLCFNMFLDTSTRPKK